MHVKVICKEKLPTRHLDRRVTEWRDLNYCLFTNNNISERNKKYNFNMYLQYINSEGKV